MPAGAVLPLRVCRPAGCAAADLLSTRGGPATWVGAAQERGQGWPQVGRAAALLPSRLACSRLRPKGKQVARGKGSNASRPIFRAKNATDPPPPPRLRPPPLPRAQAHAPQLNPPPQLNQRQEGDQEGRHLSAAGAQARELVASLQLALCSKASGTGRALLPELAAARDAAVVAECDSDETPWVGSTGFRWSGLLTGASSL